MQSARPVAAARHPLSETRLAIVVADGDALAAARAGAAGPIPLRPPLHLSESDCYLVIPADPGLEEFSAGLRRGDRNALRGALAASLVVQGEIVRAGGRAAVDPTSHWEPLALLGGGKPFDALLHLSENHDAVRALNAVPFLKCASLAPLVDHDGLDALIESVERVGETWRAPVGGEDLYEDLDPTVCWTKRTPKGIEVLLAVFTEYDEISAYLRPVEIRP